MKLSHVISEIFYPSDIKCVVCGEELPYKNRYGICPRCELSYNTKYCLRCGRAIKNMAEYCDYCMNNSFYFDMARSPLVYHENVVKMVHKLKYGGAGYLAEKMAMFMADTFYECQFYADYVTFVPMHPKKQMKRGYNQAELIARFVAEKINVPLLPTLERIKFTTNLARMTKKERADAIDGAYSFCADKNLIVGKNILLIDDVFTTGATSNQCAMMLKKAKCNKVFVLTFATSRSKPYLY